MGGIGKPFQIYFFILMENDFLMYAKYNSYAQSMFAYREFLFPSNRVSYFILSVNLSQQRFVFT